MVVNNAGYGLVGAAEEVSDAQVRHQLDTNLLGSIQVPRAALPHLRAQGGGRIIQISTMGGQAAWAGGTMYHASKWGIEGFCEALAPEVAPFGIGVTVVEPESARTGFLHANAQVGSEMPEYADTPAAMVRDTSRLPQGDPALMAAAIIASADTDPAPLRLVLGSDAWSAVHGQPTERLAAASDQRESAATTDTASPAS